MAALDGIDEIDWASLGHAYGSAEDFPQALRDAMGPDGELAGEALDHLFHSIHHQGTLYSATPWAVPFLSRLGADPGTRARRDLLLLLGVIAAADDATPEVLADVRAALVREIRLLTPLLDDPDEQIRDIVAHLLGHLPRECAAEVVPALRARYEREESPRVSAGLLAAAGRLDPPGSAAWSAGELAADRPPAVRAAALWTIAGSGLPWPETATDTVVDCWMDGEPLTRWIWSEEPFVDIAHRIDGASLSELCRTLLDRGAADAARAAIDAAYDRCVRSRSAREQMAEPLAAGLAHPDIDVRLAAARAVGDVRAAARTAVESLAAHVADPPPAVKDAGSREARLFEAGLETLIGLGDPRWREPFIAALTAGRAIPDLLGSLIDGDVACDSGLLAAVRRRLAALPAERPAGSGGYDALLAGTRWHNEVNGLTRLLHHWGPDAADAVPELVPRVPHDRWWAVRALAAIGPAASAAVPVLTGVHDDPEASWEQRLDCAQALAAITGDPGRVAACVAAAAAGAPVAAARTALRHGLPLDALLPALRDIAAEGDDPPALRARLAAARLLLRAGETGVPLQVAADVLGGAVHTADAAELAGLAGPAAAGLVPRLRELLDDRHVRVAAALAIRRVTGEAAPLVDAVRRRLAHPGCGRWIVEPLRELGGDAAPLLPELRELVHGDAAIPGFGAHGRLVRRDEEERRRLRALLAELGD